MENRRILKNLISNGVDVFNNRYKNFKMEYFLKNNKSRAVHILKINGRAIIHVSDINNSVNSYRKILTAVDVATYVMKCVENKQVHASNTLKGE